VHKRSSISHIYSQCVVHARRRNPAGAPPVPSDLLVPVYGWFTEGFDTLDLKEAKTSLDELHA
jgi:hypothetical protein